MISVIENPPMLTFTGIGMKLTKSIFYRSISIDQSIIQTNLYDIHDQGHWLPLHAKFHINRCVIWPAIGIEAVTIYERSISIDSSIILASDYHIRDQHHRKPPYANFHCNRNETDIIDILSIDIDWPINNSDKPLRYSWSASLITYIC